MPTTSGNVVVHELLNLFCAMRHNFLYLLFLDPLQESIGTHHIVPEHELHIEDDRSYFDSALVCYRVCRPVFHENDLDALQRYPILE